MMDTLDGKTQPIWTIAAIAHGRCNHLVFVEQGPDIWAWDVPNIEFDGMFIR